MAQTQIIEFKPIEVVNGEAAKFRKDINDNFKKIETTTNSIKTNIGDVQKEIEGGIVRIKVDRTVPPGQKAGDFWFKDLS